MMDTKQILNRVEERLNQKTGLRRRSNQAAVIVPLIPAPDSLEVLFEQRAEGLARSPGEVGFPGGGLEEGEDPYQAALRELEEELGIPSRRVRLLGRLPDCLRRRDERISPYVCALEGSLQVRLQPGEVASVFQVPLSFFLERGFRAAEIVETYELNGDFPYHLLPGKSWRQRSARPVYYTVYEGRLIWGITAEILANLAAVLRF